MTTVSDQLKRLGVNLPPVPRPVASYVNAVRSGNLLFVAGQIPLRDGKPAFLGKVGREIKVGRHRILASLNIYNILNSGSNTQYADGANQLYSPLYLSAYNKLSARAFQIMIVNRF